MIKGLAPCVHCSKSTAIIDSLLCKSCDALLETNMAKLLTAATSVAAAEDVVRTAVATSRRFIDGLLDFDTVQPYSGCYADKALYVADQREAAELELQALYIELARYEDVVWAIEESLGKAALSD